MLVALPGSAMANLKPRSYKMWSAVLQWHVGQLISPRNVEFCVRLSISAVARSSAAGDSGMPVDFAVERSAP
jgi:hypothetical protein